WRRTTLGEESVQLRYDRGPLPNGRPHSLYRTITDVANGEDPPDANLQRERHPLHRAHVGAGQDEALFVEGHPTAGQPARRRIGPGEQEQVGPGVLFLGPG